MGGMLAGAAWTTGARGTPELTTSVVDLRSLASDSYRPAICDGLLLAMVSKLASMIMLMSCVWAVPNQSGLFDLIAAICSLLQLPMNLRSQSSANLALWAASLVRRLIPLKCATKQPAGLSSCAQADEQAKAKTTKGVIKCFIYWAFVKGAGAGGSSRGHQKSGSRHQIGSPA